MKATSKQEHGYYETIHNIIKACNFETYLELGVDTGFNIKKILENCSNIKTVIGVDLKHFDSAKYLHDIKDKRVTLYFNTSTDLFFEKYIQTHKKFDCIFIDACHEYKQARKDYINCLNYLNDDGLIFLHDTYPPNTEFTSMDSCGDVYKLYLELCEDKNIDIINLPFWVGLSIIRIRTPKNIKTI